MSRTFRLFALLGAVLALPSSTSAQSSAAPRDTITRRAERITGRVSTDSGAPIRGAVVSVTRAPDRAFKQDSTDADGRWSIAWPEGTGDYLVHVAATDRRAFRKRVMRTSAADTVFVVDAALASSVQKLPTVSVRARRQRPERGTDPFTPTPGAAQEQPAGLAGAIAADQLGDIAALALTTPGMVPTAGGFSALGLPATQNATTLDGLAFDASSVPRDARMRATVATTAYDPSIGGFSGANLAMELDGGYLFSKRTGSLVLDAPPLQSADAVARRLGERFLNVSASGGASGMIGGSDNYNYVASAQLDVRTADAVSLFDASPDALAAAGVSADSAVLLARTLEQLGVPRALAAAPARTTRRGTALASVGWSDFDWQRRVPKTRSGSFTAAFDGTQRDALGVSPLAPATQTGSATSTTTAVQGRYSGYVGRDGNRLFELRSSVTVQEDRSEPSLLIPAGLVLVGATASAGADAGALRSIGFGGASWLDAKRSQWSWESRGDYQWFPQARHRLKLTAQSRLEGLAQEPGANRLGTYGYASLADLASGRPATYTRTLDALRREGGLWSGALALGDFWNAHDRLQLMFGARVEGNRYTERPALNGDIVERFGARNDEAPDRITVSPRMGFTWRYLAGSGEGAGYSVSQLGEFPMRPRGYIRGGFGRFRARPSAALLAEPSAATGLADGAAQLYCVGDAVPTPDWEHSLAMGEAALPRSCANGQPSLADASRPVTLVARDFDAPSSWRGNLSWNSRWKKLIYSVDGILSFNRQQPGVRDLNLRAPIGALASEGGRPMYVASSEVVPSTGAIVARSARLTPVYGRVTELVSDLRSESRQLVVSVAPELPGWSRLSLSYTLGSMQAERRGFDGAAFGDLRAMERARGDGYARHQILLGAGHTFRRLRATSVTLFAQFRSGLPYTPLVQGDVNGDGLANDRAFVFDPRTAVDTALASGMRSLLAGAPANARECLASQLGRAAARSSCTGPWTATMNARILLPWQFVRMGAIDQRRVRVALDLTNVLGGVDQLLHGTRLHGWGAVAVPEQTLYTVTGFEPAAERFRYRVNPRFGSTSPSRSVVRAPFRVTLHLTADLSRPTEVQQVDRFLGPGRTRSGVVLDSAALRARYQRSMPNVYQWILTSSDSLLLTRAQDEALRAAERGYLAEMDAVFGALAAEFARLPRAFDATAALRRQEAAIERGWEINRAGAIRIKEILSPLQFSLAFGTVQYLANEKGKIRIRHFGG